MLRPTSSVTTDKMLWNVAGLPSKPYQVVVNVDKQPLTMEVDTGAAVSLITQQDKASLGASPQNISSSADIYFSIHTSPGTNSCGYEIWGLSGET